MITPKDNVREINHHFAGNGYAIVQWLEDGYCKLMGYYQRKSKHKPGTLEWTLGSQAFLPWTKICHPEQQWEGEGKGRKLVDKYLPPEVVKLASELSADLESGRARIVNTRIVRA